MTAVHIASTETVRVKYDESTATMTAVRTASTETVRVKYGASTATMTAVRIASTGSPGVQQNRCSRLTNFPPR